MGAGETRDSTSGKPTGKPTDPRDGGDAHCRVDICIENKGTINIYNCTSTGEPPRPEPCPPPPPPCPGGSVAPGQCVPLAIGSKPSRRCARRDTWFRTAISVTHSSYSGGAIRLTWS